MPRHSRLGIRTLLGVAAAVGILAAPAARAATAALSPDGTLFEILETRYANVVNGVPANAPEANWPILALRITTPDGHVSTEIVDGTVDRDVETSASLEFDENTGTVFVAYTRYQSLYADVRVALRRDGSWRGQQLFPSPGLYLSLNPQMVVTRQRFTTIDGRGREIPSTRNILHIVWWEEGGRSQARYAAFFVEDGELRLDIAAAWNLNELVGSGGETTIGDLPASSYQFPAVQADPKSNGGVAVSFANLAIQKVQVATITFPESTTVASAENPTSGNARAHIPIGRTERERLVPRQIRLADTVPVGTVISPSYEPTWHWATADSLYYVHGTAETADAPKRLPLRADFSVERALEAVRRLVARF